MSRESQNSPQALTNLTRSIKRLAQISRIPIVISTQGGALPVQKGLKMESIGYSSSFAQDSDIVFGVEEMEDMPHTSKFHVIASRSTPRGEVFVRFDWSQGEIEEMGELGSKQAQMRASTVPQLSDDLV
jgi:hypothetical protein